MKNFFLGLAALVLTGCGHVNVRCQSNMGAVIEACAKVQARVIETAPMSCPKGAKASGRVSAKGGDGQGTVYSTEAQVTCQK